MAQPAIEWQHSFGGSNAEVANSIIQTTDGGYAIAGYSDSHNGDVTAHHDTTTMGDYWIVKLDAAGAMQWERSLGGSKDDIAYAIIQTRDGGYAVAGYSDSNDGDVTGHNGTTNYADYWIVKIDANGIIQWEQSYGGSRDDKPFSIIETTDHGYAVAGYAYSNDSMVTTHHGSNLTTDYWLIKIDSVGGLQWQKSYGGNSNDEAHCVIQTADGGYAIAGNSNSNFSGDVQQNHGLGDYWVVKTDSVGTIQWQKLYGGTGYDYGWSILTNNSGGYVIGGYSASTNGNVTGNHGNDDYWVVSINATGTILWEQTYGGTSFENTATIVKTFDGGYAVGGYTLSNDGNVAGNHGASDFWMIKMDSVGVLKWQKTMGGTNNDAAYSIIQTNDGGFALAGESTSSDGDVTLNQGTYDYWVVKLLPCTASVSSINPQSCGSYSLNSVTYTGSGTYTQNFTNSIGCDSVLTINLTVYSIDGSVSQVGGATLMANQAGAVYQWVDCGNGYAAIAGQTNQLFTASVNGNYAVVINNGSCVDTSACVFIFSVGVNPLAEEMGEVSIYPNPFTEQTTIGFNEVQTNTTIKITDVLGKEVKFFVLNGTRSLTLERGELLNGIYFMQIVDVNKRVINRKVVVE